MRVGPLLVLAACFGLMACTSVAEPAGDASGPEVSLPAFASVCEYRVWEVASTDGDWDAAVKACPSIDEWTTATALHDTPFGDPTEAASFAQARCEEVPDLARYSLCHKLAAESTEAAVTKKASMASPAKRCKDMVAEAVSTGSNWGPALKVCPSIKAWRAATKPYPKVFPKAMVLDMAGASCQRSALAKYPLCIELKVLEGGPKAQRALEEHEKAKRELERQERLTKQKQAAARKAQRTLTSYRSSARSTYASDVYDAVQRMYAANMSVIGLTKIERQMRHRLMDKYRLPAVKSINAHLAFMASNPATTCPGDLYSVDRKLARQWLGLLVRGYYPNTLSGEGRALMRSYDAALKRTSTFLRNLAERTARCR